MKTAVIAVIAVLFAGMIAASLAAQMRGPTYDPVADAQQRADVARIEALQPLETVLGAFWRILTAIGAALGAAYATALGAAHIRRYRTERNPNRDGLLPVLAIDQDAARSALMYFHAARIEDARRSLVPHSLSYAPHTIHQRSDAPVPLLPGDTAQPELPSACDLASLNFVPTRDSILLGLGAGGDLVTVPARALCHVALCGATGAGKSNLMRLLLPQLQAIGASCYLADPHYARFDAETGESWEAIESRLATVPATDSTQIAALFALFGSELQARLEKRRNGQPFGSPMFFCLDELPVITKMLPNALESLGSILREGRKVRLFCVGASQTMLVKVLGGDSSARDAYRTAFYVGGDLHSASALLDLPRRDIDESAIGVGLAMLRSTATSPARLVRVPHATNRAIENILTCTATCTTSDQDDNPRTRPVHVPYTSGSDVYMASERATPHSAQDARILALFASGNSLHDVASDLAGTANTNARSYRDARSQVESVLRSIVTV